MVILMYKIIHKGLYPKTRYALSLNAKCYNFIPVLDASFR